MLKKKNPSQQFLLCVCGQTASTTEISLWDGMKRHQEENNIECRLLWQQATKIRGNDTLVMVAHEEEANNTNF